MPIIYCRKRKLNDNDCDEETFQKKFKQEENCSPRKIKTSTSFLSKAELLQSLPQLSSHWTTCEEDYQIEVLEDYSHLKNPKITCNDVEVVQIDNTSIDKEECIYEYYICANKDTDDYSSDDDELEYPYDNSDDETTNNDDGIILNAKSVQFF